MKSYLVDRNCFEQFFIDNFDDLRKNNKFVIQYDFSKGIMLRQYRGYYSEGITMFTDNITEIEYNGYVLHNELKLQQMIRINTLIDNQQKHI